MNRLKIRSRCFNDTYHLVVRGVNRQLIFDCDDDCRKFVEILKKNVERAQAELYAWCLMGNHVHILLKEGNDSISKMMQRIGVSYVKYFNKKNERVGPLCQGRFFSKPIEDETAFERVRKYIALNPVKAGIARNPNRYLWSWLWELRGEKQGNEFDNYDFTSDEENEFELEHWEDEKNLNKENKDFDALKTMKRITGYGNVGEIQTLEMSMKDNAVKALLNEHLSPSQISRITGVSRTTIYRIGKRK